MDSLADAKAHVLRHSGTSADEAAALLLGEQMAAVTAAASEEHARAALLRLYGPDGPVFQGARLITADRGLATLVEGLAREPLDAERLWLMRRELRLLEALGIDELTDDLREVRSLLDRFVSLSVWWESAGLSAKETSAASNRSGAVVASAAAALFLERLRRPETRIVDLILDGLPFALGYLRDQSVTRAIEATGAPLTPHLVSLHESLWSLIERETNGQRSSFERLRSLDNALETVFVQIRREASAGARLAAIAALYRLLLCVRAVAVRATIRQGIERARTSAVKQAGALTGS